MSQPPTPSRRRFITGVSGAAAGAALGGAVVSSPAHAQPITYMPGFSGPANFAHGDTVTINGPGGTNQGFGTKNQGSPLVWDDASGPADVSDLWDYFSPNTGDESYWPKRRNPIRGVQPPHSLTGRYLAGCHSNNAVLVRKGWAASGLPYTVYASYWGRCDPNWVFADGTESNDDNNFKRHRLYHRASTPGGTSTTYTGWNAPIQRPGGTLTGGIVSIDDTDVSWMSGGWSTSLEPGTAYYGPRTAVNPMTRWTFFELEFRFSSADPADGFVRVYEDGVLRGGRNVRYIGGTPGPYVSFDFGAYARMYGGKTLPNNWRYFSDLYLDNSLGRVVISEGSMPGATKRSIQIPNAWSDTSITFKTWRGAHGTLAGKSLYVVSTRSPNNAIKVATIG